jgi:hypothetical protein
MATTLQQSIVEALRHPREFQLRDWAVEQPFIAVFIGIADWVR